MSATAEEVQTGNWQTMPVPYSVSDAAIAELRARLGPLTADTKEGYEKIRHGIATTRNLRGDIEKKRVELKADALAWGRKVDSEAKRLTTALLEIEEPLKAKKQAVDEEKDRARREKEEAEKAAIEAEIKAKRDAEDAKLRAEREAEEARLQAERDRLEVERQKLAADRAAEDARQQAERDRLAAERAMAEESQRVAREKLDAERRAVDEARQKLEREQFEKQAREKAEKEAAERVERERLEAEQRKAEADRLAEIERQRIEAERPDVEKVQAFAVTVRAIVRPKFRTPRAAGFMDGIMVELEAVATKCAAFGAGRIKNGPK